MLVVGDSHAIKVHVHTTDPGEVLTYGASQGAISKVIVENMQEQYQEYLARQAKAEVARAAAGADGITTVAVVCGEGLVRVFRSLGVTTVIPGGQTMNPSTAEILQGHRRGAVASASSCCPTTATSSWPPAPRRN